MDMQKIKEIEDIILKDFEDYFEFSNDPIFQSYLKSRDFWGCFDFMMNSFCDICFVGLMENISFDMWVKYIYYQYLYNDSFDNIEDYYILIGRIADYLYQ